MSLICPKCKRSIISFNFDYCLYCKEPFDPDLIREIEAKRKEVEKETMKEFLKLQYENKKSTDYEKKQVKLVKMIAVIFLIMLAIGVLFIASKIIMLRRLSQTGEFSSLLYFSAVPITIVMIGLIGFMIYRVLK